MGRNPISSGVGVNMSKILKNSMYGKLNFKVLKNRHVGGRRGAQMHTLETIQSLINYRKGKDSKLCKGCIVDAVCTDMCPEFLEEQMGVYYTRTQSKFEFKMKKEYRVEYNHEFKTINQVLK